MPYLLCFCPLTSLFLPAQPYKLVPTQIERGKEKTRWGGSVETSNSLERKTLREKLTTKGNLFKRIFCGIIIPSSFFPFYGGSTLFPSIRNPLPFSMHIFFFFFCAPVCAHAHSFPPIPRHRQSLKKRSRKEGGGASSPLDTHAEMPPPSPSLCVSARHRAQRGEEEKKPD